MGRLAHLVLRDHPRFSPKTRSKKPVVYREPRVYIEPPLAVEIEAAVGSCLAGSCPHAQVHSTGACQGACLSGKATNYNAAQLRRFAYRGPPLKQPRIDDMVPIDEERPPAGDRGYHDAGGVDDYLGSHYAGTDNFRWGHTFQWIAHRERLGWAIITACERES